MYPYMTLIPIYKGRDATDPTRELQAFLAGLRTLGQKLETGAGRRQSLMAELRAAGMAQRTLFRNASRSTDKSQEAAVCSVFMQVPERNQQQPWELVLQVHRDMLVRTSAMLSPFAHCAYQRSPSHSKAAVKSTYSTCRSTSFGVCHKNGVAVWFVHS